MMDHLGLIALGFGASLATGLATGLGALPAVFLVLMLKLVTDRRIMGNWINSRRQNAIAWMTTIVLIALAVVYAVIALLQVAGIVNA